MVTNRRVIDADGPEYYPTPKWATHGLMQAEGFQGDIWEPACGNGVMVEVLRKYSYEVIASELYPRGFGETGVDFLRTERKVGNVITNPPYVLAEDFIRHGLRCAEHKVCMLLRLAFLEGTDRAAGLFKEFPPNRLHVFSERITMYPAGRIGSSGGTTAYAWFVWDKHADNVVPEVYWIPPGTREKFSQF